MKTLPLALALSTATALSSDIPKALIDTTKEQTIEALSTQKTLDQGGINASIALGGLLLGVGLSSFLNRKSQTRDEKIAANILRILGAERDKT